jgi:hypothetical protein
MCIRTTPLTNVLALVLPLIRLSNLLKTITVHRHRRPRATDPRVVAIDRVAKRHPRRRSLWKLQIHSSLATKATMVQTMTSFHHLPHLAVNLGYAGSVCRIMDQSRLPTEFVVFPGHQGVARRNLPRTDIRVAHHSMPTYLLVPHHPSPTADKVKYQR